MLDFRNNRFQIFLAFAFLTLSACSNSSRNAVSINDSGSGIVDGTDVVESEPIFRKVLSLKSKYNLPNPEGGEPLVQYSQCSASAIGPRIILTAAHCVFENTEVQWIEMNDSSGLRQFVVQEAKQHERYKEDKLEDIAVLILVEALPPDIQILELASADDKLPNLIQAAGYGRNDGRINSTNSGTGVLRRKILRVGQNQNHPKYFSIDQPDGGACQGDSGSPALVTIGEREVIFGVAARTSIEPSEAPDRDLCRTRAEYTYVGAYLDFINKATEELLQKYP